MRALEAVRFTEPQYPDTNQDMAAAVADVDPMELCSVMDRCEIMEADAYIEELLAPKRGENCEKNENTSVHRRTPGTEARRELRKKREHQRA